LRTAWREAGEPEDAVRLFHAEDAREAIRRTEGSYGPAKRAMAALSRGLGSEEGVADQDYQTAVNQGHNVLAVLTPTPEAVERARAVLADFNVQHLRYYGPLAVTDLRTEAE
jgi:citrate lyase beta subunit